jgi:isopentenyldiphosphate isomerase
MNPKTLKEVMVLAAKRSILNKYRYHRLDAGRLGEAEVRNVMAKTLEVQLDLLDLTL